MLNQNKDMILLPKTILVLHLDLCQAIIDKGYLKNLKDIRKSKYDLSKRVWYFDYVEEIDKMVNEYLKKNKRGLKYDT
jgi:hypothetical protein